MNGSLNFWIWLIVLGGGAALLLHLYVIEIWTLSPEDPLLVSSTAPALHGGDVLVVMRSPGIERGQLVRCRDPQSADRFVVARAIARSGEAVDFKNDAVTVDRRRTPSPRGCDAVKVLDPSRNEEVDLDCTVDEYAGRDFPVLRSRAFPEPPSNVTVEPGKWFLVSDDRHIHLDSRDFGPIDANTCQHIALRLVGPAGLGDADTRFTLLW
jgi:signal peptidase I